MFQSAMTFQEASEMMHEQATARGKIHLGIPYVVLSALAFETYLKCLLTIEAGQFPDSHNFKTLFQQLPRDTRHKLRKYHDTHALPNMVGTELLQKHGLKWDWDSLLEENQDAFVLLRYPYEPQVREKIKVFGIKTLIRCTREFIFDRCPEWTRDEPTSPSQ